MTNTLISICVPTYNGEIYLRQCLDTCVNQNFFDYEIVICDDGSTDNTKNIIEEYAKQHSRVRCFQNEKNLGLVGNWNKCIEQAKGEWIKFVFQDDYIRQDCLQKFSEKTNSSINLITCKRNFILPENPPPHYIHYFTEEIRSLENTNNHKSLFFPPKLISKIAIENMMMNSVAEPSLILFRKSIVNEIGWFNSNLNQICDFEFILREGSRNGLIYIPEKLCGFRIHDASTTNINANSKYFEVTYIEPVLFSWLLLYGEQFKQFRSHLNIFQKIKLNLYFKFKCYKAYRENDSENHNYYLYQSPNHAFRQVFEYRKGNFLFWLINAVR